MKNWIQIARELPLNGSTNTECPQNCGSGEKLSVKHDRKSYWCNCYRCGFTDVEYKGQHSLAEIKRINELNELAEKPLTKLELPNDFTKEIPIHGRLWLYKAGITEARWREFGFGYSEIYDRVIMPIFENNKLVWFQCRALHHGQKPKYIQPARDRSNIMFSVGCNNTDLRRVIVVEDILSAVRVGKHTPTKSLLGTKVTTQQAAALGKYSEVITWFDPDTAGRKGANKIRRTIGLITEVRNVSSSRDPKELSDSEITKCLEN